MKPPSPNSSFGFVRLVKAVLKNNRRISFFLAALVVCAAVTAVFFYRSAKADTSLLVEEFSYATGQLTSATGGANVSGGNWV
ncbi:MAG: hypothetical protein ABI596_16865, partial [Pyrinomonadaceae bacterium]